MIHIAALLLSSLALGRAARVQELGEVVNEVSEAVKEKHAQTVQGVTYDELSGGYDEYQGKACKGRNELGKRCCSVASCQSQCNADPTCVSFEWSPRKLTCQLSTSCTVRELSTYPDVVIYIKKSDSHMRRSQAYNHNGGYHSGGYDEYQGKACKGRNELGAFSRSSVATCQSKCNADPTCVSFEWNPRKLTCYLSTSCTVRELVDSASYFVIYIKKSDSYMRRSQAYNHNGGYHSGGYDEFKGKACKGRNELGAFSWSSVANCQSKCNADPTCVSFEWNSRKLTCQLSTSCTVRELATYPDTVIYIKKSDSYVPRPTTTTTTRFHDGPTAIKAIDSSTCLSVSGNTISASHCNGRSGQTWEWTHEGVDGAGAFGSLKNVETGRCLDIGVDSCEKGTDLILDKCSAHKRNQQFQPFSDGVHFQWIKAKACTNRPFRQDLCLDVNMKSNDKNVVLWSCKMGWSASGNQRTWLGSPAHVWR